MQIDELKQRNKELEAEVLRLTQERDLLRIQCRVGDVAFQHLFCISKGKPLPDWVVEGLPNMYRLLEDRGR